MKYMPRKMEIEAIEFTGGNYGSLDLFIGKEPGTTPLGGPFKFENSSGVQRAYPGDLVVKLDEGEFSVIKANKFGEKYKEVVEKGPLEEE